MMMWNAYTEVMLIDITDTEWPGETIGEQD